jgi:type I restriction enzyme S subunit
MSADWINLSLADLTLIGSGEWLPELQRRGDFDMMGANGPIGRAARSNFGPGYLVGRVGAAGAVNSVNLPVWASDNTLTVTPIEGRCDFRFCGHLLKFLRPEQLATKNAQPLVTQSNLGAMVTSVPSTLPEQRQIAEVLDTVDEAIRKTEQIIAKLKQVKQGLLHDLLTRGIDDNGELCDPDRHPEQFKDSPLGRIPKEWEVSPCATLCREIVVGIVIKPTQYYRESGVPMLRSANVREGGVVIADLKFMSETDHARMGKSAVAPGDVVSVRTGYPGTTAVIPEDLARANCIDIIISRPGPRLLPGYLATWVNSELGKGQVLRGQGGLAQQHFNVGEMKQLLIALPSLVEQQQIVSIGTHQDSLLSAEQQAVEKLRLVKSGLMEDLLTGRVRVTPLIKDANQ